MSYVSGPSTFAHITRTSTSTRNSAADLIYISTYYVKVNCVSGPSTFAHITRTSTSTRYSAADLIYISTYYVKVNL